MWSVLASPTMYPNSEAPLAALPNWSHLAGIRSVSKWAFWLKVAFVLSQIVHNERKGSQRESRRGDGRVAPGQALPNFGPEHYDSARNQTGESPDK